MIDFIIITVVLVCVIARVALDRDVEEPEEIEPIKFKDSFEITEVINDQRI